VTGASGVGCGDLAAFAITTAI